MILRGDHDEDEQARLVQERKQFRAHRVAQQLDPVTGMSLEQATDTTRSFAPTDDVAFSKLLDEFRELSDASPGG